MSDECTPLARRKYARKVRSGCVTCKIRHVKCDEGRPSCNRCANSGRRCGGYGLDADTSSTQAEEVLGPPSKTLSTTELIDARERMAFDFFRIHTVQWMTGLFADPVWERTILQACYSENAIKHAVIAVGALHREHCMQENTPDGGTRDAVGRSTFAISQYAQALRGLQCLLGRPSTSINVALLGALLCIHFESIQERFIPVLIHAENANKLILSNSKTKSHKVDINLTRAFMRLDLQGSTYIGMRIPSLSFIVPADDELPPTFTDLAQARDCCNTWTSRLYHFMRTTADHYIFVSPGFVPLEVLAHAQDLERTFLTIDEMLWKFMQKGGLRLSLREQHGLAMLRVQAKEFRIVAAGCLYVEESLYDRFLSDFEDIYTMCKYIVSGSDLSRQVISVSNDASPLRPLWFTATHCRESWLRYSAVGLLKTWLGYNDVWHVEALIKSAQLCIAREEEGCGVANPKREDVPEWKRVHSSGFDEWTLGAQVKTRVNARLRTRANGMDGEWTDTMEVIECNEGTQSRESVIEPNFQIPVQVELGTASYRGVCAHRCHHGKQGHQSVEEALGSWR